MKYEVDLERKYFIYFCIVGKWTALFGDQFTRPRQLENGTPAITPANKNIFLRGNAKSMNGFSLRLYPGSQNLFKVYCGINETGHSKTHFDSDQFCCCIFLHESIYLSKYMINTSQ